MKDQRLEIKDIVMHIDDATLGRLDIPEFQRGFVWNPEKVKKLVDSLWRGYPIGIILLWESKYSSPRYAEGTQTQKLWIIDGQQRITAFSLLFGKKPYWWPNADEWNKAFNKYDVLVNITKAKDSLEFALPNPVRKASPQWISVRSILTSDNLSKLAQEFSTKTKEKFDEVHERLQSLKKIETYPLYEIIIDHDVEDVAEIFTRLNMAGVKVRESDVVISFVAARQQGWVRGEFNPFLKSLEDKGVEIDPAILIRSLAVIGKGIARLKSVPEDFWGDPVQLQSSWNRTKASIAYIVRRLNEIGVLSSDILPSHNALIPLFTLYSKFDGHFNFKKAFHWFLLATGDGRYSGSAITTLDQDIKTIMQSKSFDEAIIALESPLHISPFFAANDFLKDYEDEFMRLILYLIVFNNKAKDWVYQDVSIGYDRSDNELNEGFKPEWHHFFPKKLLRDKNVQDSKINLMANIVVLNEKANKKFRAFPPGIYIRDNEVKLDRLQEQFIPIAKEFWEIDNYDKFLEGRAQALATKATDFLSELKAGNLI